MREFVLGVISSLVASGLLIGGAGFRSRKLRQWLLLAMSRFTGVGIVRAYRTQQEANRDLQADLANARWVKVLAGRGNELTRDSFQPVWRDAASRLEAVQVLLPDPCRGDDSWLAHRAEENARHDKGYDADLLAEQVRSNISYIRNISRDNDRVTLRLYDLPNLCRIVATDKIVYLTTYSADVHGRNSPCLVFHSGSAMYDLAMRIFATTWTSGRLPLTDEQL